VTGVGPKRDIRAEQEISHVRGVFGSLAAEGAGWREPRHPGKRVIQKRQVHAGYSIRLLAGAAPGGRGMAEPEGKGPLERPIDWFSRWKASFEWLAERIGRLGAVLVLLLAASSVIW
jgi:hypothetical protein